jgi:endonuclease III-like uncharacterized protein
MSDAEIYAQFMEIRGVGPWTVDMLTMFTLCRPEFMPVSDYGVRKGYQVLYRKRALPAPKQLAKFTEKTPTEQSPRYIYGALPMPRKGRNHFLNRSSSADFARASSAWSFAT